MRTLQFTVNSQTLSVEDASGLAVGSENYIEARFVFDSDWANCAKVAEFDEVSVLLEDDACVIPDAVLLRRKFSVRVVGRDGETKITTNTIVIRQGE
ncbi:MAG: hypothetical protein LUD72_11410 [Bacteroidales bacterium]|nr:hypothetical protein [Bacteroidales bacterium]